MPGKILAPLDIKLRNVKWGQYRLDDLFEIQNTSSFNTDKLTEGKDYDYVTRTSLNQGILQTTGFVNDATINPAGTWSLGLLQMDFFYRNKPWYAGQFVRKVIPKIDIPERAKLFFQTILNMQKSVLLQVLVRNVDETFRNINVQLPQTDNNEINFTFIEEFLRELERARLRELEAYLKATGLDNYELTKVEKEALLKFKDLQWKEFRIGKIFKKLPVKKATKANVRKFRNSEFSTPVVYCKYGDNGIMYWGRKGEFSTYENVISIVYNGAIAAGKVYAQKENTGILAESYFVRIKDEKVSNHLINLFCASALEKNLYHLYSRDHLATWNKRVENDIVWLPTTDGKQPDFNAMERLIAAMQKIVIADVAKYTARNLEATQEVIDNQEERQEPAITPLHIYDIYQPGRIPLYTLRAACGYFDEGEVPEPEGWIDATGNGFTPDPKRHFAIHAKGDSMLPKIKDGDICIFEWYNAGTRNDEIVLTQSREYDPEYGGKYTIKRYHSEKVVSEEGWQHSKVELRPLNPDFDTVELTEDDDIRTIGIFKCVLLLNN